MLVGFIARLLGKRLEFIKPYLFSEENGEGGQALARIASVEISDKKEILSQCNFRIACDVTNPLCGSQGATYIYGPQKGVTPDILPVLDAGMKNYAEVTAKVTGKDNQNAAGAGAAALGSFKNFATSKFLGLNCVIWIIILCYVFFFWFMKWTRTGRKIYAVGSNPSAAEVSGINVKNINLLVYTIMGILAGLGGALQVSIYASAMPDMQYGGEMDVIAACVIGGVSMSGGRGTVVGAFLGSIILATIAKALPLVGISSLWQNMIKGVIILVVVVINVVLQRIADKNALKGREM